MAEKTKKEDKKKKEVTRVPQTVTNIEGTGNEPFGCTPLTLSDLMFMGKKEREVLLGKAGGVQGLAKLLRVDNLAKGLNSHDGTVQERTTVFGVNRLPPPKYNTFWGLVLEAASDKIMILLSVAAVISIVLGTIFESREKGWIEGTAILCAVIIVIFITAANNYSKEIKFRALNAKKEDANTTCIRDGVKKEISIYDVVVGDVLIIRTGAKLCADGVLIEGFDIAMNESSATGESKEVRKQSFGDSADSFFYSGTDCVLGEGQMLVIAVGDKSFGGQTTMALRKGKEDQPETPLQANLGVLAGKIGKLGTGVAIVLFLVLVMKFVFTKVAKKEPFNGADTTSHIIHFLITSLAIIVVAVPEGLPLAVTIALAFSMTRMMKDNNLVRNLDACETMGGATAICSDKTGTLTQNKMTVVRGWLAGSEMANLASAPAFVQGLDPTIRSLVAEAICANSSAEEQPTEDGKFEWIGSKTEVALLQFIGVMGLKYQDIRASQVVAKRWPFASARKRMSTALTTSDPAKHRIHMKGASEIVLEMCTHMRDKTGNVVPIKPNDRLALEHFIASMASCALRTMCLAYCDALTGKGDPKEIQEKMDEPDGELTLVGLFGIEDPLRPEAALAVLDCQKAGITVRMVTGDNLETARNIAKQCHIIREGDDYEGVAIEGPYFRSLARRDLLEAVRKLRVLARSSPLDKQILVEALQEMDEIVAVTGDGTNDGPALARANVGFAMNTGTDVAKEASAIILMDDNFASIVKAVLWGRNVFDSIRKFIQLQVTINVVAVTVAFIGAITDADGKSPLNAVQLLWVNLVMDAFAALSLATDLPTPDMLDRKPYGKSPNLVTRIMWKHIMGIAIYQLTVIFAVLYGVSAIDPHMVEHDKDTLVFNLFVCLQLGNEFNCRRIYDEKNVFTRITKSPLFIGIMIGTFAVQAILVELGGNFVQTTGLDWRYWLFCLLMSLTCLPVDQVLRCLPHFKDPTPPPYQLPERAIDRVHEGLIESTRSMSRQKSYTVIQGAPTSGSESETPMPRPSPLGTASSVSVVAVAPAPAAPPAYAPAAPSNTIELTASQGEKSGPGSKANSPKSAAGGAPPKRGKNKVGPSDGAAEPESDSSSGDAHRKASVNSAAAVPQNGAGSGTAGTKNAGRRSRAESPAAAAAAAAAPAE